MRTTPRIPLLLCSLLVPGALATGCAGGEETQDPDYPDPATPAPDPQPGPGGDDGDDSGDPTATLADLPACDGAGDEYVALVQQVPEVVDFYGPNISIVMDEAEVVVVYPAIDDYGAGTFKLADQSSWNVELCVNWDDAQAVCETTLYAAEGTLVLDELEKLEDDYRLEGALQNVVFVDQVDDPSCSSAVSVAFKYPL